MARLILTLTLLVVLFVPSMAATPDGEKDNLDVESPLSPFDRLIGGQWHLGDSYQEFEWGLGKLSVRSRGFAIVDGEARLVSEGQWMWHPGQKQIRGFFNAIEMPVVFFDYTTRFEGDRMINDLKSYDAQGNMDRFTEHWVFKDNSHYLWELHSNTPDGPSKLMSGTFTRK